MNSSSVIINRTPGKIDPRTITPGDASIPLDMIAWYDAANINGLLDGDQVSSWNDRSGHGYNAAGTNKPIYKTAIQNGLPIVRFSSSGSQRLDMSIPLGSAVSIFVIGTHSSTGSSYIIGSDGTSSTPAIISSFTTTYIEWWNDNSPGVDQYVISAPDTGFHLYEVINTQNGGNLLGYKDGSVAFATTSTTPLAGYNISYLGGSSVAGNYTGDIAEVIIYNRAVSSGERVAIESYLRSKWGTP